MYTFFWHPSTCIHIHLHIQMNFRYFESVISDNHIILKMLPLFKNSLTVLWFTFRHIYLPRWPFFILRAYILFSMHASTLSYVLRSILGNCFYILKEPQRLKLNLVFNKISDHSLLLPFIHSSLH